MSRIGRRAIAVPSPVTIRQEGQSLTVEGPKGKLSLALPSGLTASVQDAQIRIERSAGSANAKANKAMHGLYRALVANCVRGVTEGFSKELEIVGVGYRAQTQGKQLSLYVGYSHSVLIPIPDGVTVETPKPTTVVVKGIDKHLVGQLAADIRRVNPPEPYRGKGIRYVGELIRRKAGKAATGSKGAAAG